MTKILIGLAVGGLLTLLSIYPAYSRLLPELHILKSSRPLAEIVIDTMTES